MGRGDLATHVVVFDVNVWMDVARWLGPEVSWAAVTDRLAIEQSTPVGAASSRQLDSARALAVCLSGKFVNPRPLQVWTSSHIDNVLVHKLTQPVAGAAPEDRGLGWTVDQADDFLHGCVYDLVFDLTEGGTVGEIVVPHGNPPLDHEDGCVHRTAIEAGEDPAIRYLVTNDRSFRESVLPGDVAKLYPYQWVQLVRRSRSAGALRTMRPPV